MQENISQGYLFSTPRLGFRTWQETDCPKMAAINNDPQVMEFFPRHISETETAAFIERMQLQYLQTGSCYFAVERLDNASFIGFIGLSKQLYQASFTPCTDIGWRLCSKEWNKGYATEGAARCLTYAFEELSLDRVFSVTPIVNTKSQRVMEKLKMQKREYFEHPLLINDDRLRHCVVFEKRNKLSQPV